MCLAVPGLIEDIDGDQAEVNFGGVTREANISLVDADIGDYIIVHAGYAIERLEEEEAKKSLEAWNEVLEAQKQAESR